MRIVHRTWSTGDILDIIRFRGFRCIWIMQGGKTELGVVSAVNIGHQSLLWQGSARVRSVPFFTVLVIHVFCSCRRGWSSHSSGTAVLTLGWAVVYWVIPGNSTEFARWQRRHSEVSSTCVGAVSISWTLYIGGLFILASLLRVLSTRLIGFFFSGSGIFEQSGARG